MGEFGIDKILLILLIVLLLFGARRIPELAGSMGKGIREFKRNLSDPDRVARDDAVAAGRSEGNADRVAAGDSDPVPAATPRDAARPEPKRLME